MQCILPFKPDLYMAPCHLAMIYWPLRVACLCVSYNGSKAKRQPIKCTSRPCNAFTVFDLQCCLPLRRLHSMHIHTASDQCFGLSRPGQRLICLTDTALVHIAYAPLPTTNYILCNAQLLLIAYKLIAISLVVERHKQ